MKQTYAKRMSKRRERKKRKKSCCGLQKKKRRGEMEIRLANLKITREIIFILNQFDATHLFWGFADKNFYSLLTARKQTYFLTVLDSAQLKFIVFFFDKPREKKYHFGIEEKVFIYF